MNIDNAGVNAHYIQRVGDVVSAYVSNNHVAPADLPMLIASVHTALQNLASGGTVAPAEPAQEKLTTAQIRKSIQQDGIVSFLDGKSYATLKRHLTKHGLDPQSYRDRYGLPVDYPMVAPSYSQRRSELAKSIGLGQPGGLAANQEKAKPAPKGRKKAA